MEMKFSKEDKEKVVEFLNLIAKNAKFEMNTSEIIKYFKLLSHMQSSILPKIDSNILEVVRVVEPEPKKKRTSRSKK
jgi:hypothetical protein